MFEIECVKMRNPEFVSIWLHRFIRTQNLGTQFDDVAISCLWTQQYVPLPGVPKRPFRRNMQVASFLYLEHV